MLCGEAERDFVAVMDSDSGNLFASSLAGTGSVHARGLTLVAGQALVAGTFTGTLSLKPNQPLESPGNSALFLARAEILNSKIQWNFVDALVSAATVGAAVTAVSSSSCNWELAVGRGAGQGSFVTKDDNVTLETSAQCYDTDILSVAR